MIKTLNYGSNVLKARMLDFVNFWDQFQSRDQATYPQDVLQRSCPTASLVIRSWRSDDGAESVLSALHEGLLGSKLYQFVRTASWEFTHGVLPRAARQKSFFFSDLETHTFQFCSSEKRLCSFTNGSDFFVMKNTRRLKLCLWDYWIQKKVS